MPIDVPCSYPGLSAGRVYTYPVCTEWGTPTTVQSVADLFTTRTAADIAAKRAALAQHIWAGQGPYSPADERRPIGAPVDGNSNVLIDLRFGAVDADKLERLTFNLPLGADSKAFLFRHNERPRKLVVYCHQHGTGPGFVSAPDALGTIRRWYEAGADVLAFALPGHGDNTPPTHNGSELDHHNEYWAIEEDPSVPWSPVRFFVDPIVRGLHEVRHHYARCIMQGLSGGGWTTHLCAALDERIDVSYPVAGSQPWYIRRPGTSDMGDYEQQSARLLSVANYLDWYVMACSSGRRQLQVLNRFDACCFSSMPTYAEAVREAVSQSGGGAWQYIVDSSHDRHAISAVAMASMLRWEELGTL